VPVEKIYESQAGNYRHRQEGLSVRLSDAESQSLWVPKKRIESGSYNVESSRKRIYRLREKISQYSHLAFAEAKEKNSFVLFMLKMLPLELYYYFLNKRLIRGSAKLFYHYVQYLKRRMK
jgi:hypothetical protein